MAGEVTNFKLEIAAGMVRDYSSRWATGDQDTILADVIEILRRCHEMSEKFDVDDLAESIADYCIAAYGPPLYDFATAEERSATVQADVKTGPSTEQHFEGPARVPKPDDLPPELDIPDQH